MSVAFDTSLRPDVYELRARLVVPGDPPIQREESLTLTLAPRRLPHRMPVMMWGIGSPSEFSRELPRLQQLGFTHCLGFSADYGAIWKAQEPIPATTPEAIAATNQMLDTALAHDFGIAATLYAGAFLKQRPELARVDRQGKPYARHDCNAALPGLAEFSHRVGASVARTFGQHPGFVAALINSEVRDDSEISFSQFDRDAYKKFSGHDYPPEVVTKYGVAWKSLPGFPSNRVVPDGAGVLSVVLDRGRWLERLAHRVASGIENDGAGRLMDLVRPGDSRSEYCRKWRRGRCVGAVDLHGAESAARGLLRR